MLNGFKLSIIICIEFSSSKLDKNFRMPRNLATWAVASPPIMLKPIHSDESLLSHLIFNLNYSRAFIKTHVFCGDQW